MTKEQWKVIIALVRYVLSRDNEWVEFNDIHAGILFGALNEEEENND